MTSTHALSTKILRYRGTYEHGHNLSIETESSSEDQENRCDVCSTLVTTTIYFTQTT